MSRLDPILPAQLSEDQQELYTKIIGGPRGQGPQAFPLTDADGGLQGPFNAMLLSPRLGIAIQSMGATLRYSSPLTPRGREIAILVAAHRWNSDFEIYAHEATGRLIGLTDPELLALREGRYDVFSDDTERLVATTVFALATRGDLTDAEFDGASCFGAAGLFELTTLVGYYAMLALQLTVFRVSRPPAAS